MTCGPVLSFEAEKALIEQLAQLTDGHLQCLIHEANIQRERTRVSRYLVEEVSPEQVEEIVRQSHLHRERNRIAKYLSSENCKLKNVRSSDITVLDVVPSECNLFVDTQTAVIYITFRPRKNLCWLWHSQC
jgi:hypothetical protein